MSTFSFNGVDSSTYSLTGTPREPLLGEKKSSTIEIPGRDGSYDFNLDSYRPKLIPVDCLVQSTTEAALTTLKEQIALWLSGSGWLIFSGTPTKRIWAKVYEQVDLTFIPLAAPFTVVFECQPYAESTTETTIALDNTATDYASKAKFYPELNLTLRKYTNSLANGDMSTTSNYTVTNLISNAGAFENTTGWTGSGAALSVSGGQLLATGSGVVSFVRAFANTGIATASGKKMYCRAKVRVTNSDCTSIKIAILGSTGGAQVVVDEIATPTINEWYTLYDIGACGADFTGNVLLLITALYADAATANGKVMEIDGTVGVVCADLTTTFTLATRVPSLTTFETMIQANYWTGDYVPSVKKPTGWISINSLFYAASNVAYCVGNGALNACFFVMENAGTLNTLHKYYARASMTVTNAVCTYIKIWFDGSTAGTNKEVKSLTPTKDVEYLMSAVDTPPADATGNFRLLLSHNYSSAANATDAVLQIKNVYVIDLTTIFGAGNEPTATQMDGYINAYLAAQSVTWFSATADPTWIRATLGSEYVEADNVTAYSNGDVVTMDMSSGYVTKNGSSHMAKLTMPAIFFDVPTGSQTITITSDGAFVASMDYRKRYLLGGN